LLVGACAETAEYSDLPVLEVHGDDFQSFTVEELAANSDLIVAGTISAVALSELTPAPELEDFGGERNFLVTLDIETVIGGALNGALAVTIEVYGLQVDEGGEPEAVYVVNGMPVPLVGSTEVWFLREREPGLWGFTDADDGRFARSGDTLTALATTAGPAARNIENLGFSGLVDDLN
jgi:hypothetical protein